MLAFKPFFCLYPDRRNSKAEEERGPPSAEGNRHFN